MNKDVRTVTTWLLHGVHSAPPSVVEAAQRIAKPKRKAPPRPPAPRNRTKGAERAARLNALGAMRDEVFGRSDGDCQAGMCPWAATELHHAISGPLRRKMEAPGTMFALCDLHHDLAHAGDLITLGHLATYAVENLMPLAAKALARRIAKIEDTRARRSPETQRSER